MIDSATNFQFERIVRQYARWIAVDEDDRSPAPAWWWAPALALRDATEPLPHQWSAMMRLTEGACYADAARLFLAALAGQATQPWPDEFPLRYRPPPTDDETPGDKTSEGKTAGNETPGGDTPVAKAPAG